MSITETTLETIAADAYSSFERGQREPESQARAMYTLKDGSPEWIKEAVHAAHGDMLPDDYVYETAREAFGYIADNGANEDSRSEFADDVEIYTSQLAAWIASSLTRLGYCDEACEEFGADDADMSKRMMLGQYWERGLIFDAILSACEAQLED